MAADGELSSAQMRKIRNHLAVCTSCVGRMKEIQETLRSVASVHQAEFDSQVPPLYSSRALLKARLAEAAAPASVPRWRRLTYASCGLAFLLLFGWMTRLYLRTSFQSDEALMTPNPRLTPGAVLSVSKDELCTSGSLDEPRSIPASMGQMVFREYGIPDPRPRSYELDYLIDPALGGSNDVRNLWPEPYSVMWNARVKDALENRLHDLVCNGQLSLATAQRDISTNWISAYRKYFHTDEPMPDHLAFIKDTPWSN